LFLSAAHFGLLFVAMDRGMPAGLASLVMQLQVVFTIGLGVVLLDERLRPLDLVGGAIALTGLGVIAAGRNSAVPLAAIALCVSAAASWAVGNLCTKRAQAPDPFALLVWSSLVPPVPLLCASLTLEGPTAITEALTTLNVAGILALLYIVVVSTLVGFGLWAWLLRRHAISRVAPYTLLVPVVGIAAAWAALGERPEPGESAGAVLVLAGAAVTTRAAWRARRTGTCHP
jgi:O-acetylserine/cysteine efflux transporter